MNLIITINCDSEFVLANYTSQQFKALSILVEQYFSYIMV